MQRYKKTKYNAPYISIAKASGFTALFGKLDSKKFLTLIKLNKQLEALDKLAIDDPDYVYSAEQQDKIDDLIDKISYKLHDFLMTLNSLTLTLSTIY